MGKITANHSMGLGSGFFPRLQLSQGSCRKTSCSEHKEQCSFVTYISLLKENGWFGKRQTLGNTCKFGSVSRDPTKLAEEHTTPAGQLHSVL